MAFSFKQRECATCGGTLRFNKEANEYECIYCGNLYEREEQYDGQFSVRYAAVQALSALNDVSVGSDGTLTNWQMVQNNLNDCQKIDPSYPGSIVAHLAASITRVRFLMNNKEAVRTDLAQAQSAYAKLGTPFDADTDDVEADFYDNIESSDVRSLLIGVFGTFHDSERVSYIEQGFNAEQVSSVSAASAMFNRAFSNGDYRQVDELLQSPAQIDADELFGRLLKEYPDSEQKISDVSTVIMRGVSAQRGRDLLSDYLESSSDSLDSKLAIAQACLNRGVVLKGRSLGMLISSGGGDDVLALLSGVGGGVFTDNDVTLIVRALLTKASAKTMTQGFDALAQAGYYLDFPCDDVVSMLERDDLSVQDKTTVCDALNRGGLGEKRRRSIFAALLEQGGDPETKIALLDMLAERLAEVNPMSVENYLMRSCVDGAAKPQVLAAVMRHVKSRETLRSSAARYPSTTSDPGAVRDGVIAVLRNERLI